MIVMDALTLIKTRHSTRKFLRKPVEKMTDVSRVSTTVTFTTFGI